MISIFYFGKVSFYRDFMSDDLERSTSEALREFAAIEKMRDNEVRKYVAAAIDRLSTATAVVGIFGPIVTVVTNGMSDHAPFFLVSQSFIIVSGGVLSYGLHLYGKMILRRGLR
ncbi:hypothetical protein CU100_13300 [Phyllobacterium endophyticum]|uniref:MotA/TolQ/ExbB proton channel domain-containing protein n=2 Tax=Phyllobacterium endophyticum TaxID=1149773 RepID=A0A2P7AWH3_9HYPH|nr:hypothetical protein CU100_13300 [Phyllobacterium endophyticum]